MSYNPTIASARRAAKQIARDTGAPYQATLDAVAQQAGRADWNEYLSSPAPVPSEEDRGFYVDGPEHEHNVRSVWLTALATTPAILTIPFILGRDQMTIWGNLEIIALIASMWMFGAGMMSMFMSMMAVHPDVPEIGRDGTRLRHTTTDLAKTAMGISLLMLVGAYFTRDLPRANFPLVAIAAGISLVTATIALKIETRMFRRVMALIAANGMVVAGFAAVASIPR